MTPVPALTARADVRTDKAPRYAKQLISHLGRKLDITTVDETSTMTIGDGIGRVVVGDGVLTLLAEAADESALALVQHVLGSHLARFGARDALDITWTQIAG